MTDSSPLGDRIADVVRAFPFDDFGMDDVSYALEADPDTQEWVPKLADAVLAVLRSLTLRELEQLYRPNTPPSRPELRRMADETQQPETDPLAVARATNQRLNLRAQQLESELAAYRRAVAQWEISDGRTYVPLRTLTVIAKAAGRNIETPQWLQHYQRVEQAEAVIERVTAVVPFAEQVAATSGPGPASAVRAVADRLRAALGAAAPTGGPSRAAGEAQQPKEA